MNVVLHRYKTCFATTSDYDNYDTCTINVEEDIELEVISFDTELYYDYMYVNGQGYSGSNGPDGVFVEEGQEITFSADSSNTGDGFDICGTLSSSPTDSSDSNSTWDFITERIDVIIISIGIALVICMLLYICNKMFRKEKREVIPDHREGMRPRLQVRGEVGGNSGRSLVAEQSVEGGVDLKEIGQSVGHSRYVAEHSFDDVRPLYSITCTENDHPIPILDTEINIFDVSSEDGHVIGSKDESYFEAIELAPPAFADMAPPDYKEAPPAYQPLEVEVEESEGLKGIKNGRQSF